MILNRLLTEHQRIHLAIDQIDTLLDRIEAAPFDAILSTRWAYARQILMHLDYEDTHVFASLAGDARPAAAETAACFAAERDALSARFESHARAYWSDGAIEADRFGYRDSLRPLLTAVRCAMTREEGLLYPLLADARSPNGTADAPKRWMPNAWRYRAAAPFSR